MPNKYTGPSDPLVRFWSKVDKNGPVPPHNPEAGPCWIWTGGCFSDGYGQIEMWDAAKQRYIPKRANRLALEMSVGRPLLRQEWALHGCDRRACIRVAPGHVYLGGRNENTRDAHERRRFAQGERNAHAKLTDAIVLEIRARYARGGIRQVDLGREYGIPQAVVSRIIRRTAWAHV